MSQSFDPYELTPDAVQDPPATLGRALLKIGPGLILAGSIVGTGELIQTTQVGAQAGFVLLWLVLLSCFIKVFVQVELGRYSMSSGETTLTSFRSLPYVGSPVVWWWLIMVLVTQTQIGAMIAGVGEAMGRVIPGVHELVFPIVVTLVTMALLLTGSYRLIERVIVTLVVIFTFMTVACVLMLPYIGNALTWDHLAQGFTFQVPESAIMSAFAMIGITGVGASELIMYPYWCIEKGYARNVGPNEPTDTWLARARGWMRVMYLDVWVSLIVYTTATIAFYLLGAAVLYDYTAGAGLPKNTPEMIDALAAMYAPVLGKQAADWFIVIGVFAVLYSTLFAAIAAHGRTLTDWLRVNKFVTLRDQADRLWWIRLFSIALCILGLVLALWMKNPVLMVAIGGVMQAVTLPIIAAAAVYLRYARTDRRLLAGSLSDGLLLISAFVLFAVAGYGIWKQFSKTDVERVQGQWRLAEAERDGSPLPSGELAQTKLTITLNRYQIAHGADAATGGTFRLDAGTIDVERTTGPDLGTYLGIYALEDGVYKVCLARPGDPRPTEFSAPAGSGRVIHVWKR